MKTSLVLLAVALAVASTSAGPVSDHGRLQTQGRHITGQNGQPVSLAGVSFFWSQWQGKHYNAKTVRWLQKDWNATIIRAALGLEKDGYLENPTREERKITTVVDAAIAADLYVIIDWHDHHAHLHTDAAIAFFQNMARRYGSRPHVIYEIYNEPLNTADWSRDVKPYAEKVIAAIRAIDPDNLIIVGTPTWSQDVDIAAANPLIDTNVAYTLHFYAGSHKQPLRDKALVALKKNIPLFVTEWGTCDASGAGAVDRESTAEWMQFMREWGLSHCNWAISTKKETASLLLPHASVKGQWSESHLSPSGQEVRRWIRHWSATPVAPTAAERPGDTVITSR